MDKGQEGDSRMAEHKHGEMDIEEHKKTFDNFVHFWFYLFLGSAAVLILLALTNA